MYVCIYIYVCMYVNSSLIGPIDSPCSGFPIGFGKTKNHLQQMQDGNSIFLSPAIRRMGELWLFTSYSLAKSDMV